MNLSALGENMPESIDILSWFDVGPVSAERDKNLIHYFYDGGVTKSVIGDNKRFLILGRKGAGKTAVFEYLKTKPTAIFSDRDCVIPLSLVDYNWNAHALLARTEKASSMTQRDSWRLVIAIEAIRAIAELNKKEKRELSPLMDDATRILEKIFSKPVPSWGEIISGKLFQLSKMKLPSGGLSPENVKADGGEVSFEAVKADSSLRNQLSQNVDYLTSYLEDVLRRDSFDFGVFIVFDRLDEAWTSDTQICKEIVAGLLQAAEHALSKYSGRVRPIVFLREDIFPTLSINDKNKLRQDCSSTLLWNTEGLTSMLVKRINFYASLKVQPPINAIDELFNRKEMRNRTTPARYIFARTMMRPRDVVSYYRTISDSMKDDARDELGDFIPNNARVKLDADAIYEAEPKFGEYLYEEIIDEWKTQKPEIENFLNALTNLAKATFTPEEYKEQLRLQGLTLDEVLFQNIMRFLYDNSIIGFQVGESKLWRFKSVYPSQSYIDSKEFRVHSGLIRRLNLREPYKSSEDAACE